MVFPYLLSKKLLRYIGIAWCVVLLTSCEKSIAGEENGEDGKAPTAGISAEVKQAALTIAQAQAVSNGTQQICVKGFIVAATRQSIGNATFSSPFSGNTAIVLADKKSTGAGDQFSQEELFPVCLTDAKTGIKDAYNLEDNAKYWNCFVYIVGTKDQYMSLDGLKKVTAIEIDPSVTGDGGADDDNGDIVIHFSHSSGSDMRLR